MEGGEAAGAAGHADAVGGKGAADAVVFLDLGPVRLPVGGGAAGEGVDGGVFGDVLVAGLGLLLLILLGLLCAVLFGGLPAPSEQGEYGHLGGCAWVCERLSWWESEMEPRARPATKEPPGAGSRGKELPGTGALTVEERWVDFKERQSSSIPGNSNAARSSQNHIISLRARSRRVTEMAMAHR